MVIAQEPSPTLPPWRALMRPGLFALAYGAAQVLAFHLPGAYGGLAALWPASGIAVAGLLLCPRRQWLPLLAAFFVAGVAANLTTTRPLMLTLGFMVANSCETAMGAWVLVRLCGEKVRFDRLGDVFALIVVAVVVNATSALLAAATVVLVSGGAFWPHVLVWWIGDGLGLLLVTPLVVTWALQGRFLRNARWHRLGEGGVLLATCYWMTWVTFARAPIESHFAQPYVLLALIVWAAVRFGPLGVSALLAGIGVMAVLGTMGGAGAYPFGGDDITDRLLMVQMFIGVAASVGLMLAGGLAERKASLEQLRRSEAHLRAVGDNLPNGILLQVRRERDGRTSVVHVSAGVERLHGISAGQVRRRPALLFEQVFPEDRRLLELAEAPSRRDLTVFDVVVRVRRADGQIRWMHLCAAPSAGEEGSTVWDGLELDITGQRATEEALRREQSLFDTLINTMPDHIYFKDRQSRFIRVSRSGLQHFGLRDPREVIGKTDFDFFREEHARKAFADEQRLLETGEPLIGIEEKETWPDGRVTWVSTSKVPLRDTTGSIVGLAGVSRDVTERRRMENALQEQEERFRQLFTANVAGVALHEVICDAAGRPCDYRFLQVNPAFERITGLKAADLLQRTVMEVMPQTEPVWIERYGRVALTGKPDSFEHFSRVLGRHFEVAAYAPQAGQFAVLVLDITERKKAEEALRESLREKEALLKEVHHRVKNNLQVISSLLRLHAAQMENPLVQTAFAEMQNRVRSMALLHETLYQSGSLARVNLAVYLGGLCAQLFRSLGTRPGEIRLVADLAPISVDATQAVPCGLLVNELVSNCLKHAFPDGRSGEVRVSLKQIDAGPKVRLTVADNGIGLPANLELSELHSLGLQLVSDLTRQIAGNLAIGRETGAVFAVTFIPQSSPMENPV